MCMCMCVCTHASVHVGDVSSGLVGIAGTLPLLFCAKLPWLISWWGHIPSTFASPHTFTGDEDRRSDNSDTPPLPPSPLHLHPSPSSNSHGLWAEKWLLQSLSPSEKGGQIQSVNTMVGHPPKVKHLPADHAKGPLWE